jgi:hypothetical protein
MQGNLTFSTSEVSKEHHANEPAQETRETKSVTTPNYQFVPLACLFRDARAAGGHAAAALGSGG